ncbi:MAG: YdaS family helix-turn-helix protein [Sulfuriferula sp.]
MTRGVPIDRGVLPLLEDAQMQYRFQQGNIAPQNTTSSQWKSGHRRMSAETAVRIELAAIGAIRREGLRPDIFGPLREEDASGHGLTQEKEAFASQEERHG